MAHEVARPDDLVQRKQSGPSRALGKAGLRRFESVLEAGNIVVQAVATENDIGRDAFVDIVRGTDVTGGVICVQVKSGKSFFHNSQWVIPGKPSDFTLWRESTIPVFGIVHDPATDSLRWVDLSHAATLALDSYLSPVVIGPYGKPSVPVPDDNRLDLNLEPFLTSAEIALRRRRGSHSAALLSDDIETVETGIADIFAIGRHDPTAFLLLAALLQRLPKVTRRLAAVTLALTTSHPDVFWTKNNWIPGEVSDFLRHRIRWTEGDIVALLAEIDEDGVERGTIGQTVFHVLDIDKSVYQKFPGIALNGTLPDNIRFWAAAILLYESDDAPAVLEQLMATDAAIRGEGLFPLYRNIQDVEQFEELIELIDEWGYINFF